MSTKLGFAMIIREDDGTTTYDKHSLRSPFEGDVAGGDFGSDDDDDELDGDDFGDELGDELADDVGDETGDDVGDEVGGRRRRHAAHAGHRVKKALAKRKWQRTAVAGTATITAANGSGTILITPATYIKLKDITFTGSGAANGAVKSITVGDRLVWSSSTPVPTAIFASTGFLRNMLEGSLARPGVPIIVEVVGAAANDVIAATLLGSKPVSRC